MVNSVKATQVEDANIVAFLMMRGLVVIPYIKREKNQDSGSQVAWEIQGDSEKIDAEVKLFYSNIKIGIHDFVKALKEVRGQMYNIKQVNNKLKKDN